MPCNNSSGKLTIHYPVFACSHKRRIAPLHGHTILSTLCVEGFSWLRPSGKAVFTDERALHEILERVNDVSMQVSQIATAAEEQTATTNEITNNIHAISQVVQHTSQGAHESAGAAQQMVRLAENLQVLVHKFSL